MANYNSLDEVIDAVNVLRQADPAATIDYANDRVMVDGSEWGISGTHPNYTRVPVGSSRNATLSALTPAQELAVSTLAQSNADNAAALALQATTIAEEKAKVEALEEGLITRSLFVFSTLSERDLYNVPATHYATVIGVADWFQSTGAGFDVVTKADALKNSITAYGVSPVEDVASHIGDFINYVQTDAAALVLDEGDYE